jgi:hypothetical protein
MLNYIINIVIILLFLYASYSLWKLSKRRKENSLLLKMISLFILIHLVIFPIIYVLIINNNPKSIEIDNKILSFEKEIKLKDLELSYSKKDIENQKLIIEEILNTEIDFLKESEIAWPEYYDNFEEDEEGLNDVIYLKNSTLLFYMRFKETPATPFGRFIIIYPKDESFKSFELNGGFEMEVIDILKKELNRLKLFTEEKFNQLNAIKSNKFWSYKEVLPYTINILFTDSFKPKSRVSNIIYFIHNLVVAIFLLSFIVSLSQSYIIKEEK